MCTTIQQGFYSNRSDLIRTAIRNLLNTHAEVVKETIVRKQIAIGVLAYNRKDLEARQAAGEKMELNVVGMVHIAQDVTPELARAAIQALKVYGVLRASPGVRDALADRIR